MALSLGRVLGPRATPVLGSGGSVRAWLSPWQHHMTGKGQANLLEEGGERDR